MNAAFLLFAPCPPFIGRAHLVRATSQQRTVCGRATSEKHPTWALFGTALKFGWAISEYRSLDQVRGKLCRSCQPH